MNATSQSRIEAAEQRGQFAYQTATFRTFRADTAFKIRCATAYKQTTIAHSTSAEMTLSLVVLAVGREYVCSIARMKEKSVEVRMLKVLYILERTGVGGEASTLTIVLFRSLLQF